MGAVLGANVMRDHNVVFDYDNHRMGFAEGVCDYTVAPKRQEVVDWRMTFSVDLVCCLKPRVCVGRREQDKQFCLILVMRD